MKPKDITKESARLAEEIVHDNLKLIRDHLKDSDDALPKHEADFAIQVMKLVGAAIESEKDAVDDAKSLQDPKNLEALRQRLRATLIQGKQATA